jgi:ADP-dependent NAD(P)H-hydrate dehydratase / NAD(P)H-hydrate epimerase
MLSIAVPESIKNLVASHLPEALIVDCPENKDGAIASIPFSLADLTQFQAIACGPGLTKDAQSVVEKVLQSESPLVLDADGLNIVAAKDAIEFLSQRNAPTILTPHWGEFKRLFPTITDSEVDRLSVVQTAAQQSQSIILLKGARTAIANSQGQTWIVPHSTPALARGGSGDVLTGLTGGLVAQAVKIADSDLLNTVATAAWWHAQAGIRAAQERTELGVDATTLAQYLNLAIANNKKGNIAILDLLRYILPKVVISD